MSHSHREIVLFMKWTSFSWNVSDLWKLWFTLRIENFLSFNKVDQIISIRIMNYHDQKINESPSTQRHISYKYIRLHYHIINIYTFLLKIYHIRIHLKSCILNITSNFKMLGIKIVFIWSMVSLYFNLLIMWLFYLLIFCCFMLWIFWFFDLVRKRVKEFWK